MKRLLSLAIMLILCALLLHTKTSRSELVKIDLGVTRVDDIRNLPVQHSNSVTKTESKLGTLAFYYPWYGTPDVSGKWNQWNASGHDPERITDERRDIAAAHYPFLGVYDSNNESLIKQHIDIAKEAGIDGFIVSWWGKRTFEDNASLHVRNVCEQNNFTFTFYYERTIDINQTEDDLRYIIDNNANSSAFYKIDNRPVIYVYSRARDNLKPKAWKLYGNNIDETRSVQEYWFLFESIRKPPRYGIFPIEPKYRGTGFIENAEPIFLPPILPNESYILKAGISDMRNDAGEFSDVGFNIKISTDRIDWKSLLDNAIVDFSDGWLDLSFNISDYADQNVWIRAESFAGGKRSWESEWAAVDYFYIENSNGEIVSPEPFFDNGWKTVAERLTAEGLNLSLCMDLGGYESEVQNFAEYFLNFTDGMHIYNPIDFSQRISRIFQVYNQASSIAHSKNKMFVATVTPGFDNSALSKDQPTLIIDRYNGTYYRLFWSIAKACFPDGYAVTTFNEWLEGTEIEPSLEYGYLYVDLTRTAPNIYTVDASKPADFPTIQEAINAAGPGEAVIVSEGTYAEGQINVTKNLILLANGTVTLSGLGGKNGIYVAADNVAVDGFRIIDFNANYSGIRLDYSKDAVIIENNVADNVAYGGFFLTNCGECLLRYNNASQCGASGIELYACKEVTLKDNQAASSNCGIRLTDSSRNIISGNNVTANNSTGLCVTNSSSLNRIFANDIVNNGFGIDLSFSSNNNTISENCIAYNTYGIRLWASLNNTIYKNNIAGNIGHGISFRDSSGNSVARNNITENRETGIFLETSSTNSITGNKIASNHDGIYLNASSHRNGITENRISANIKQGILAENCSENKILENTITRNEVGVRLLYSENNQIAGNDVAENEIVGLELYNSGDNAISLNSIYWTGVSGVLIEHFSSNNTLTLNNVTRNPFGISLRESSTNNTISGNDLKGSSCGIDIYDSTENMFYHNNFLNNTQHVVNSQPSWNYWDAGYPIGGNYWSDYSGQDMCFGQFQNETGFDWIGDLRHTIDQDNADRYPLTQSFVPEMEEIRMAYRSLLVKYTEMTLNLDSLTRDFTELQKEFDFLRNRISFVEGQIVELNSTIKEMEGLLADMEKKFNSTTSILWEQVNFLNDQMNNIVTMMYIFMAMATVLIVTIVYLALRRSKTKTER